MNSIVLIVDDAASNRELVRYVLDRNGYSTREADSGAAALRLLHAERPDLVLSDVQMPEVDGYTLARAIRTDPDLQAIPIVFYTAHYITRQDVIDAADVGVNRIVGKTGNLDELLDAVADALRVA